MFLVKAATLTRPAFRILLELGLSGLWRDSGPGKLSLHRTQFR